MSNLHSFATGYTARCVWVFALWVSYHQFMADLGACCVTSRPTQSHAVFFSLEYRPRYHTSSLPVRSVCRISPLKRSNCVRLSESVNYGLLSHVAVWYKLRLITQCWWEYLGLRVQIGNCLLHTFIHRATKQMHIRNIITVNADVAHSVSLI